MLLNASTHWNGPNNTELWTFAVNYTVHAWNHTPKKSLDHHSPKEVFSGSQKKVVNHLHCFTWGCPVYVLEEEIQQRKKSLQEQASFLVILLIIQRWGLF